MLVLPILVVHASKHKQAALYAKQFCSGLKMYSTIKSPYLEFYLLLVTLHLASAVPWIQNRMSKAFLNQCS